MAALRLPSRSATLRRGSRLFEKLMAAIALLNFGLVIFDLSYIPLRDLYLEQLPSFTRWYGTTFKGIEPSRSTEAYIKRVATLDEQVAVGGLSTPETQAILTDLQQRSEDMIDQDPFQATNKSGTLERIKERMRAHVSETTDQDLESAKQAFKIFWTQDYLEQQGFREEINFFSDKIQPLIATNYFRGIGFDGRPQNQFLIIDIIFIWIFGGELLLRSWFLSRRYSGMNWLDAILWRWYDLLFLVPFSLFAPSWALLRVIPLTIRINQSNLIDLEPLRNRITRGIVANIAVELTEIVVIRLINQVQSLVNHGSISNALLKPDSGPQYVDLNGVDEVGTISERLSSVLIYQVLPTVRPEIEALMQHTVTQVVQDSPLYKGVQIMPGLNDLSDQLAKQVVAAIYQNAYQVVTGAAQDEVGAELTQKLVASLGDAFRTEIQKNQTVEELESLLAVWLEEVKINYVQRLAEEDREILREKTQRLYEMTQKNSSNRRV